MNSKLIYSMSLIATFFLATSCTERKNEQKNDNDVETKAKFALNPLLKKSTEIIDVHEQPIVEQLTLSGKVSYNENNMVAFRSLLEGIVEQVHFELGDYVKKGQVLATVRSVDIQGLYQQQRFQENQIALLEKQLDSKKAMATDGLVSAPEVLAIEHELAGARIERDRIRESLQLYRATGNGLFQIVTPKDGYIIQKEISVGQRIQSDAEPLFSVSNLKEVWVMVNIYATDLRYVKLGDEVKVRTIAYPDQFYSGKIDKIDHVFDEDEHVLKARVVLPNQQLHLMPDMSADILINMKNSSGSGFAIPNRAKVFSNNKDYIVVYRKDDDMEVRRITPIGYNEEYTYIAEKLKPGERVIGSNALLVFEQLNH